MSKIVISEERTADRITIIRGKKVILDSDIASLYEVETKVLNQAVSRNKNRFPSDFMFRLTQKEFSDLRSQFVTSSWGGRRNLPYAFTEQGVAMLSSVLNSPNAIKVNILIIRTFVKLRNILQSNQELLHRIEKLERDSKLQGKTVIEIYNQIDKLLSFYEEDENKEAIGFRLK